MSNNKKVIPMAVPGIGGGQQQQIQINEMDTIEKHCSCGCELFDVAYRYRVLPSISMKNPTGKDVPIKLEVFICHECGLEFGKAIKEKQ